MVLINKKIVLQSFLHTLDFSITFFVEKTSQLNFSSPPPLFFAAKYHHLIFN